MEGHYGKVLSEENVIASFGRFFPQFDNVQYTNLKEGFYWKTMVR